MPIYIIGVGKHSITYKKLLVSVLVIYHVYISVIVNTCHVKTKESDIVVGYVSKIK